MIIDNVLRESDYTILNVKTIIKGHIAKKVEERSSDPLWGIIQTVILLWGLWFSSVPPNKCCIINNILPPGITQPVTDTVIRYTKKIKINWLKIQHAGLPNIIWTDYQHWCLIQDL
jgi:hypothetical protein